MAEQTGAYEASRDARHDLVNRANDLLADDLDPDVRDVVRDLLAEVREAPLSKWLPCLHGEGQCRPGWHVGCMSQKTEQDAPGGAA